MLKNIIAPVQAWLLYQGKCVGCGKKLPRDINAVGYKQVTCSCGRIYMYDAVAKKFRRATFEEIK